MAFAVRSVVRTPRHAVGTAVYSARRAFGAVATGKRAPLTTPADTQKFDERLRNRLGSIQDHPDLDPWQKRSADPIIGTECYMTGPFGTEENPVLIPSREKFRWVACMGGRDGVMEHEPGFFPLRAGPIHRCPECGQCFVLDTVHPGHVDHPDHKYYESEKEIWETPH